MDSKTLVLFAVIILLVGGVHSFKLDMESGWNLVSGSQGFDASELVDECDVESVGGHKVWGFSNGSWTHPDHLSSRKAFFLNLESSCEASVTPAESEQKKDVLESGWSLTSNSISGSWTCEGGTDVWKLSEGSWSNLESPKAMKHMEGYWMRGDSCSYNETAGNRTIRIQGLGGTASYEFTVDKWVEKEALADPGDEINGRSVSGAVSDGSDVYSFQNEIEDFSKDAEVDIYLDGEKVDTSELGSVDGSPERVPDKPGIYPRVNYSEMDQYYVSPSGSDNADGTRDDPWSVGAAVESAGPGDVVNFLPGSYEELDEIEPPSGEEGNPVVFRSSERHEAKIQTWWAFHIKDKSHVHVQGFHVEAARTFRVRNSDHITIRDNFLDAWGRTTQFNIKGSEQVKVLNNNIRENGDHNGFIIFPIKGDGGFEDPEGPRSRHVLVAGNSFSRAGHQPAGSFANRHIAFRGNVFHNMIGRNFGMNGDRPALFEENLVVEAANSPSSASSRGKFTVQNGIFRFNVFHDNIDAPVTSSPYAPWNSPVGPVRVYNNVFASQRQDTTGYILWDRAGDADEYALIEFENNIFDTSTSGDAQMVTRTRVHEKSEIDVNNNLFDGAPAIKHSPDWVPYTLDEAENELSDIYYENKEGQIRFRAPSEGDFRLKQDSPGINGGKALTSTVNSGSGREVEVKDSHYFHGGLGIQGLKGDTIRIGDQVTKVEQVDWENNLITLGRSVSWDEGEPVGIPWKDSKPDVGAMQAGESFAQIEVVGPEKASVGDNVTLEAKVNGDIDVREVCWQFGDGEGDCGTKVSNIYESPYDYGVRVRVIDQEGNIYWGNHLLYVSNESVKPSTSQYREDQCSKFITEETGEEC